VRRSVRLPSVRATATARASSSAFPRNRSARYGVREVQSPSDGQARCARVTGSLEAHDVGISMQGHQVGEEVGGKGPPQAAA
jgi:hypothetical protein